MYRYNKDTRDNCNFITTQSALSMQNQITNKIEKVQQNVEKLATPFKILEMNVSLATTHRMNYIKL